MSMPGQGNQRGNSGMYPNLCFPSLKLSNSATFGPKKETLKDDPGPGFLFSLRHTGTGYPECHLPAPPLSRSQRVSHVVLR